MAAQSSFVSTSALEAPPGIYTAVSPWQHGLWAAELLVASRREDDVPAPLPNVRLRMRIARRRVFVGRPFSKVIGCRRRQPFSQAPQNVSRRRGARSTWTLVAQLARPPHGVGAAPLAPSRATRPPQGVAGVAQPSDAAIAREPSERLEARRRTCEETAVAAYHPSVLPWNQAVGASLVAGWSRWASSPSLP